MTEDVASQLSYEQRDSLKQSLTIIINETGLSSVEAMSEQLGIDEKLTSNLLRDLVNEGAVAGHLTEDASRFFRTDVKQSDAPIAIENQELEVNTAKRGYGIYVPIAGLVIFIAGQILHNTLGQLEEYWNMTSGIVMGGLIILIMGLVYITLIDSKNKPIPS